MTEKKVLFYTSTPRFFRGTLVGHLFSLSQEWPVVLASEKLDAETEKVLRDKKLFPKLEKIVPVEQFSGVKRNLFAYNKYLYKTVRGLINQHQPDIVISVSDMHSLFDMYLFRFAKKAGAKNICFQPSTDADVNIIEKWIDVTNSEKFPTFLPLPIKMFLVRCRKYAGHILYYWILPILVGQRPFWGKSSYMLMHGNSGMRDADYQVVFSERDFNLYVKAGVNQKKLKILPHPLVIASTNQFFRNAYFKKAKPFKKKTVLMLMPITMGVRMKDRSPILHQDRVKTWVGIIKDTRKSLPGWDLLIKPHPAIVYFEEIKKEIGKIDVTLLDPKGPIDELVEACHAIINLPRAASTVIFTATLQCPGKPIAALDFEKEVLGDMFKGVDGVDYITTQEELKTFLKKINAKKVTTKKPKLSSYSTLDLLKSLLP